MNVNVDDAFDDVKAAYAEVAAKSSGEATKIDDRSAESSDPVDGKVDTKSGDRSDKRDVPRVNGKFAPRKPKEDEPDNRPQKSLDLSKDEADDDLDEAEEPDDEADDKKPVVEKSKAGAPPPSWSVKSKASWDDIPEHVRADILRRETEVAQGFAALKDYKDLKPYAEMAAKHNTTISAALKHYTGIENVLRQDIGQGLALIVQNYGLDQSKAAQLFSDLARKYGGVVQPSPSVNQNGAQPQLNPNDPLYNILKPFIEPLKQEVTTLRQSLTSREQTDRNVAQQSLAKAIETFSADPENRYFTDLEETITRLFETGMVPLTGNHQGDLKAAYDLAAQMVPEVREALIEQRIREQKAAARKKEQDAAAKAKSASRSVSGSRVPGLVQQADRRPGAFDDIEDDVRAAYRLHSQF